MRRSAARLLLQRMQVPYQQRDPLARPVARGAPRWLLWRADLARCLVLLRYAKVLDFMLTSLAAHRDIHPQTLRTLFRLANLKVDDAYPV